MIFIGYQGVGKSTLAQGDRTFIDLESSHFFVNGVRDPNWHIVYCSIAESLSRNGYNVFVSSHKAVRDQLSGSTERVITIYPSLQLKKQWIQKLYDRYADSGLDKDYKAWKNAEDRFDDNIKELADGALNKIQLTSMNYSLGLEITRFNDAFVNQVRRSPHADNPLFNSRR